MTKALRKQGIADLLRLLGSGATSAILMALGSGPLRTKELTERVPGYTPRTVYRYVSKLVEVEAVERDEELGVPSKVVHRLTDPSGVDLRNLVMAYASAPMSQGRGDETDVYSSGYLALLAELWESGMFGSLNVGPSTATELARIGHGLSFHQVSRRTNLFVIGGLLAEIQDGRRRRYQLTERARLGMGLIAGLGRWRERHVVPAGQPGLTTVETVQMLGSALPLVVLPQHAGKRLQLIVASEAGRGSKKIIHVGLAPNGAAMQEATPTGGVGARARGRVPAWIDAVLGEPRGGIRAGAGDGSLVKDFLYGLHTVLWSSGEAPSARAVSGVRGEAVDREGASDHQDVARSVQWRRTVGKDSYSPAG